MPTYEYECRECGHSFEVSQNMSDEPLKDCPVCGKSIRRIIFGGSGVIFKGSGFYVNDAKGSKSTAKPVNKEGGEPAAAASADSSTDKKSGAASDGNTAKTGSGGGTEQSGTGTAAAKSTGAST